MVEKSNIPQVRFKGFTEPWEQCELRKILSIDTDTNSDNKYARNDVLSVSDEYGIVNQIELQGRSFAADDVSKYKKVKHGQIVYTRSPLSAKPYGIIKIVDKYEGILSPLYIVNSPLSNVNSRFVYYYFDLTSRTNNYLQPLVRMGAKHTMNISNEEWLSGEIMIPSYDEQSQIGVILLKLDDSITLHQRKCERLQDYKKALLQKMFPTSGSDIPKIRFKGFTEPWEQRKVGDIIKSVNVGICDVPSESGKYEVIQQGNVPVAGYTDLEPYKDYQPIVLFGDHTLSIYKPKSPFLVASDGVKAYFLQNVEGNYFAYLLEKNLPTHEGYKRYSSILKDKEIKLTFDKNEEIKIGDLLGNLDTVITLHQRKCEKLKNIKKALLQTMFC